MADEPNENDGDRPNGVGRLGLGAPSRRRMRRRLSVVGLAVVAAFALGSTGAAFAGGSHESPRARLVADTPPARPFQLPGVFGTVTTVNGSAGANSCGTAGAAGSFVLLPSGPSPAATSTDASPTDVTVDVTTSTTYEDPGVSSPSFANVCVGEHVGALGAGTAAASSTITATSVFIRPAHSTPPPQPRLFGTVTSVNGSAGANSCGTAGAAGSFVLSPSGPSPLATPTDASPTDVTVDVTTSTTYEDLGVTSPSFANVCVAEHVGAVGAGTAAASSTFTATNVFIVPVGPTPPPHPQPGVFGTVTSVNGSAGANSCGTAGAAGSFVLSRGATPLPLATPTDASPTDVTVDVTTSTTYEDPGVTSPSFANVCVGAHVSAMGAGTAAASATFTATSVFIVPVGPTPPPHPQPGVFGTVTSVNGSAGANSCGTAGAAGSFVLSPSGPSPVATPTDASPTDVTVDVTTSTTYEDPGVTSPSFANVCVGEHVGAVGAGTAAASSTFTATSVFVAPAPGTQPPGGGQPGGGSAAGGPGAGASQHQQTAQPLAPPQGGPSGWQPSGSAPWQGPAPGGPPSLGGQGGTTSTGNAGPGGWGQSGPGGPAGPGGPGNQGGWGGGANGGWRPTT